MNYLVQKIKKYKSISLLVTILTIGLIFISNSSTNNSNILIVKPAKPKSTVIVTGYRYNYAKDIYPFIRNGYQVQHVSGITESGNLVYILVKY